MDLVQNIQWDITNRAPKICCAVVEICKVRNFSTRDDFSSRQGIGRQQKTKWLGEKRTVSKKTWKRTDIRPCGPSRVLNVSELLEILPYQRTLERNLQFEIL